ncbi:hypothetical protein [Nocardia rhizosphaerihabitans]|uniref:Uncharacterized protein n=1 Tax=Nocardia rhizosphaerihabitans TaxID=1691570 RepID=A0ABQ2KHI9_9NOCA|nr:hypothetical protein [Nocardia rhizosphaerihabitans]GGN82114.1 hypothetical protein GCM10011610_33180 [Nocardia rhizosphaerihabitans]
MPLSRLVAPCVGSLAALTLASGVLLAPGTAHATAEDTLAATPISDAAQLCTTGAPTFDDVVTAAASVLRGMVGPAQLAAYDLRVADFRAGLAAVRVHRDGLPVQPDKVGTRPAEIDDPIVTYLVNGLDAVRTGRIDQTMSVSRLTVSDAIEVFILATGIVKIPARLAAGMVPTVGFFLKPIVGAAFSGTKALARAVQGSLDAGCVAPNVYPPLELGAATTELVQVPQPIVDLAAMVMTADGTCTPIADLTLATVVERSRAFLDSGAVQIDTAAMHRAADDLQVFLASNRVAAVMLMRRSDELGPLVETLDMGPVTFLADLGADLAEGTALDTVPLAQVQVENAFDLATLTLDITSLLFSAGTSIAGYAGVADAVLTPLSIVQKLAFAPTDYGAPIVRGVIQSMCAV